MNAAPSASWVPDRKIWSGGLASLATWLVTAALEHWGGLDLPSELVGLIVVGVYGGTAYLIPPSIGDFLARVDGAMREAAKSPAVDASVAAAAARQVATLVTRAEGAPPG